MAVIVLIVMGFYDISLMLLVLGITLFYGILRISLFMPLRHLSEEQIVAQAKQDSHFMESVRAIQTIKLFQKEHERENKWKNLQVTTLNKTVSIQKWNIFYNISNHLLFGLENILVIYFGATMVIEGNMTVGMLFAFVSYKNRFIAASDSFIIKFLEFKIVKLHLERISDIAFTIKEKEYKNDRIDPSEDLIKLGDLGFNEIKGDIVVSNLSYTYGTSELPVFKNLNFKVLSGESVAIVGPSGCGKSTLLKCLMGLLEPTSGTITIDGKPLKSIDDFRPQISAIMQDDNLLSGTLADNISCFDSNIDYMRVEKSARLADIHEDIIRMPMKYNTLVGDMGSSLSGGQKQRIFIARALYREPKILFMDEATSHLDNKSEKKISIVVQSMGLTRIIVAHRKETILSADRCIELNNSHE